MNSTATYTPRLTFPAQKVATVGTKGIPVSVVINNTGLIDMVVSSFNISRRLQDQQELLQRRY